MLRYVAYGVDDLLCFKSLHVFNPFQMHHQIEYAAQVKIINVMCELFETEFVNDARFL